MRAPERVAVLINRRREKNIVYIALVQDIVLSNARSSRSIFWLKGRHDVSTAEASAGDLLQRLRLRLRQYTLAQEAEVFRNEKQSRLPCVIKRTARMHPKMSGRTPIVTLEHSREMIRIGESDVCSGIGHTCVRCDQQRCRLRHFDSH